jgi:hypothetical protein
MGMYTIRSVIRPDNGDHQDQILAESTMTNHGFANLLMP